MHFPVHDILSPVVADIGRAVFGVKPMEMANPANAYVEPEPPMSPNAESQPAENGISEPQVPDPPQSQSRARQNPARHTPARITRSQTQHVSQRTHSQTRR